MDTNGIVEQLIEQFSTDNLVYFFRDKMRTFTQTRSPIHTDIAEFSEGIQLGEFKTDISELAAYCFKVNKTLTERSGKKAQYELAKKILKQEQRYAAGIFVFYDDKGDFRFSLVYDIISTEGKRTWSNFRRYTYFVSKEQTNKTFIKQIGDADFSTIESIKEAFSVEKVTKQFYNEIAGWYFWALKNIKFPDDAEKQPNGREVALIRFITRIMFIWFMKEKKLIHDNLFKQDVIQRILTNLDAEQSSYYKAILQNLFFATLNTPIKQRKFRRENQFQGKNQDYMNHSYYRYHKLFKNPNDMLSLFGDIPFLNGGLFECLDKRKDDPDNDTGQEIRLDGFSDIETKQPTFPNKLFFADDTTVDLASDFNDNKFKTVHTRGIIHILSSYNFTVDENTSNDEEIALDPELLGKVFENLLAAYNPETATTARKATGSYYTPREVVNYMIMQSLQAYFINQYKSHFAHRSIELFEENLQKLFVDENNDNPFDEAETTFMIEKKTP